MPSTSAALPATFFTMSVIGATEVAMMIFPEAPASLPDLEHPAATRATANSPTSDLRTYLSSGIAE
jgi:hypothetical protein